MFSSLIKTLSVSTFILLILLSSIQSEAQQSTPSKNLSLQRINQSIEKELERHISTLNGIILKPSGQNEGFQSQKALLEDLRKIEVDTNTAYSNILSQLKGLSLSDNEFLKFTEGPWEELNSLIDNVSYFNSALKNNQPLTKITCEEINSPLSMNLTNSKDQKLNRVFRALYQKLCGGIN